MRASVRSVCLGILAVPWLSVSACSDAPPAPGVEPDARSTARGTVAGAALCRETTPWPSLPPGPFLPPAPAWGDLDGDGHADVVAAATGGVQVLLGRGDRTFLPPSPVALPAAPWDLRTVDVNGDGHLDVVASCSSGISVLLGHGDGTFAAAQLAWSGNAVSVAPGDLNGDGAVDLVVANQGTSLTVLLGHGDGTFAAASTRAGTAAQGAAVGDFNGDGKLDVVVTPATGTSTTVTFLRGRGDGKFALPATIESGQKVLSIVAGDVSGDGALDLVTNTAGVVTVLLGHGDGTFTPQAQTFGPQPGALLGGLLLADLDGDGALDLAASAGASLTNDIYAAYVLLGRGDGTFHAPAQGREAVPAGSPLAAPDLDGDGVPELVSVGYLTLDVVKGRGDGTFDSPPQYPTPQLSRALVTADWNGDGNPDVAVGSADQVAVLLGTGTGTLGAAIPTRLPHDASAAHTSDLARGDFNGDGWPDLVSVNNVYIGYTTQFARVTVLLGAGDGTFTVAEQWKEYAGRVVPAVADFNGDGKPDLLLDLSWSGCSLYCGASTYELVVRLGRGHGGFGPAITTSPPPQGSGLPLIVDDWNGDGKPDVAMACGSPWNCDNAGNVLLGQGDGTFQAAIPVPAFGIYGHAIAAADWNGDGLLDLATSGQVFLGHGDGTMTPGALLGAARYSALVPRELDGDGVMDLAAVLGDPYGHPSSLGWMHGNGDGTFAAPVPWGAGAHPVALAVADLDGDHRKDFISTSVVGVSVLLGACRK